MMPQGLWQTDILVQKWEPICHELTCLTSGEYSDNLIVDNKEIIQEDNCTQDYEDRNKLSLQ